MKYRSLGKTGITVSEIGYGAWGIGGGLWQGAEDEESLRALRKAADLGVNFFDTALAYGNGHSEQLIGRFLKDWGEPVTVATKIPPKNRKWPAQKGSKLSDAFPADYIIECTEESLRNLAVERIDVLQFHVWDDGWTDDTEWSDAVNRLKEEGKLRAFGISINDHQPENSLKLLKSGKADTVQVIYNIFDQSPEEQLLPFCRENNIGVIVRVPFDEGSLTGTITPETVFPENDFRNRYFRDNRKQQVNDRVQKLEALLGEEARALPELALRFCLHHPAVSTVIPGMRTVKHVESNCAVADHRRLSDDLLQALKGHRWEKDFYH